MNKDLDKIKHNPYTVEEAMKKIGELQEQKEDAKFIEKIKINKEIMSLRKEISKHVSPRK